MTSLQEIKQYEAFAEVMQQLVNSFSQVHLDNTLSEGGYDCFECDNSEYTCICTSIMQ
jgi:hypothetical protein